MKHGAWDVRHVSEMFGMLGGEATNVSVVMRTQEASDFKLISCSCVEQGDFHYSPWSLGLVLWSLDHGMLWKVGQVLLELFHMGNTQVSLILL